MVRRARDAQRLSIAETARGAALPTVDVIALDEALTELAGLDPDQARIIELRFFAGLTVAETAKAVGVSRATVLRDWSMARVWLYRRLTGARHP